MTKLTRREFVKGMLFTVGGAVVMPTTVLSGISGTLERERKFGEATLKRGGSALENMNKRRVALAIMRYVEDALFDVYMDPMDDVMRSTVVASVQADLQVLVDRRALTDFKVTCDEVNNPAQDVEDRIVIDVWFRFADSKEVTINATFDQKRVSDGARA